MTHFGIISPPVSGHLHPLTALGRELQARGHRVTCFQVRDVEEKIRALEMDFWPIGESDHPVGSLPQSLDQLGRLKGLAALRFTIRAIAKTSIMVEMSGTEEKIEALVELLKPYGIKELARTGVIAMPRGTQVAKEEAAEKTASAGGKRKRSLDAPAAAALPPS